MEQECPRCGSKNVDGDFSVTKSLTPTLRGSKVDYDAGGELVCNDCGYEEVV